MKLRSFIEIYPFIKIKKDEIWGKLPVKSLSEFLVSTQGRIFNKSTGNLIKGKSMSNGQKAFDLKIKNKKGRKTMNFGYAVALTFLPKNKKMKVKHIDGNLLNNNLSNIAWR